MNPTIYQTIFDKLQDFMPPKWDKLVFYAGYSNGSYSMKYYIENDEEQYIDCFSLQGVKKSDLIKLFIEINKDLSVERESLNAKQKWTVLTMIVDKSGKMRTEFDYADISENSIAYEQEWKKRYLVI